MEPIINTFTTRNIDIKFWADFIVPEVAVTWSSMLCLMCMPGCLYVPSLLTFNCDFEYNHHAAGVN